MWGRWRVVMSGRCFGVGCSVVVALAWAVSGFGAYYMHQIMIFIYWFLFGISFFSGAVFGFLFRHFVDYFYMYDFNYITFVWFWFLVIHNILLWIIVNNKIYYHLIIIIICLFISFSTPLLVLKSPYMQVYAIICLVFGLE